MVLDLLVYNLWELCAPSVASTQLYPDVWFIDCEPPVRF